MVSSEISQVMLGCSLFDATSEPHLADHPMMVIIIILLTRPSARCATGSRSFRCTWSCCLAIINVCLPPALFQKFLFPLHASSVNSTTHPNSPSTSSIHFTSQSHLSMPLLDMVMDPSACHCSLQIMRSSDFNVHRTSSQSIGFTLK